VNEILKNIDFKIGPSISSYSVPISHVGLAGSAVLAHSVNIEGREHRYQKKKKI